MIAQIQQNPAFRRVLTTGSTTNQLPESQSKFHYSSFRGKSLGFSKFIFPLTTIPYGELLHFSYLTRKNALLVDLESTNNLARHYSEAIATYATINATPGGTSHHAASDCNQ
jgi:hypothetical protein